MKSVTDADGGYDPGGLTMQDVDDWAATSRPDVIFMDIVDTPENRRLTEEWMTQHTKATNLKWHASYDIHADVKVARLTGEVAA